ncbi:MAG: helix-turn-helix domain-containing protein [Candidatus Gastranaerophilales bacterium]|nr:helix-turn-helix domain-containing protein [Candidatus Gastranaerophilales bacterium]
MSQDIRRILAKNVAKLRIEKGFTKEGLSLKLGFDNSCISKLEKCIINITLDRLELIAKEFGVAVKDLLK